MPSTMTEMKAFAPAPKQQTLLHPVTLSFRDKEKETEYRAWFFDTHGRSFRFGLWTLAVTLLSFGVFEYAAFGDKSWGFLLVRYGLIFPFCLVVAPFFLHPRFYPFMRKHAQKVLFLGGVYLWGCFTPMGVWLFELFPDEGPYYGGMVFLFTLIFVYFVVRMRFLFSTILGFLGFAIALILSHAVGRPSPFMYLTLVVIGLGGNFACMFGAYLLERYDRLHFMNIRKVASEQGKVRRLLHNILPETIASRLKDRPGSIADGHGAVTVVFADIVGFTPLSQQMTPTLLVALLNEVFSEFDRLVGELGVEKIKTIGDAYMAASGLPIARPDHAIAAARLALAMLQAVDKSPSARRWGLKVRIGLHSGPVVAGVIGERKFIYDLWGDTVNTASRMESHGAPGQVHVSEETARLLERSGRFELSPRGVIEVKGKGEMRTFWLVREEAEG